MTRKVILLINKEMKMSLGKLCSQVAHAMTSIHQNASLEALREWKQSGYKVVCLKATELEIRQNLRESSTRGYPIFDAGRTQVPSGSLTVAGFGPIPENSSEFDSFSLM